jgi:hypothetical protein
MSAEHLESTNKPFKNLDFAGIPLRDLKRQDGRLEILGLNLESTVDDVRRTAISFRRQFQEKGLNANQIKALQFVLQATEDCPSLGYLDPFLNFMLSDKSFDDLQTDINR